MATSQITRPLSTYAELLARAGILVQRPGNAVEAATTVSFATDDSRQARLGTLFVCKGAAFRRDYLLGALEAPSHTFPSAITRSTRSRAARSPVCW